MAHKKSTHWAKFEIIYLPFAWRKSLRKTWWSGNQKEKCREVLRISVISSKGSDFKINSQNQSFIDFEAKNMNNLVWFVETIYEF
jgi:hypothetical protein